MLRGFVLHVLMVLCAAKLQSSCNLPPQKPQDRRKDKTTLRIASFNVHWLFDGQDDPVVSPYNSLKANDAHIQMIAQQLRDLDADVVALQEVENCEVLELLLKNLEEPPSMNYRGYLTYGDDVFTSQNVALLTRIDPSSRLMRSEQRARYPIRRSECNFRGPSKLTGLSKHFIVGFDVKIYGQPQPAPITQAPTPIMLALPPNSNRNTDKFPQPGSRHNSNFNNTFQPSVRKRMTRVERFWIWLVNVHMKAGGDARSCAQREGQAQVIQSLLRKADKTRQSAGPSEIIVLGDFNDFDDQLQDYSNYNRRDVASRALDIIKDFTPERPGDELLSVMKRVPREQRFSTSIGLLDHIMVSPRLAKRVSRVEIRHEQMRTLGLDQDRKLRVKSGFSDHFPVLIELVAGDYDPDQSGAHTRGGWCAYTCCMLAIMWLV